MIKQNHGQNSMAQQRSMFWLTNRLPRYTEKQKKQTGLFPTWIPGTQAALFHDDKQITKSILAYICDAKHTPEMWKYLIRRSKEAIGREKPWDSETYETIAWKHFGESFGKLSLGQKIQILKYTNDLLPTAHQIQTLDNQLDGQCFACTLLWETVTHVLTCSCEASGPARMAACNKF
jgi:hypothetical protein